MELESALELQRSLERDGSGGRIPAPQGAELDSATAYQSGPLPGIDLGIAPQVDGSYHLAVRVTDRATMKSQRLQAINEVARGEADIYMTSPVVAYALNAGDSISHVGQPASAGTLGAFVRMKTSPHPHLLSNHHVLVRTDQADDPGVVHPGLLDGGDPITGLVASVTSFVDLQTNTTNSVDAACAELLGQSTFNWPDIPGVGPVTGTCGVTTNLAVNKRGRTTSVTSGVVTAFNISRSVQYGSQVLRFAGQIEVSSTTGLFSEPGDSGSLVVTDDGSAVGLLFAGAPDGGKFNTGVTYLNPIQVVFDQLGCDGFWS